MGKPSEFKARFERVLQKTKLAKSVNVVNDPIKPGKIFMVLQSFPEDTKDNRMLAGIELSPTQARRLYKELGDKIRYMDRMSIEKGE